MPAAADIWLGDFVRCLRRIDAVDDARAATIARLLSLGGSVVTAPRETPENRDEGEDTTDPTELTKPPIVAKTGKADEEPAAADLGRVHRSRLRPVRVREVGQVVPPDDVSPLEPYVRQIHGRAFPHEPLWEPRWTRALVAAAVAVPVAGRSLDVERAVEVLARGRPLVPVPRRRVWTLAGGVQVLVDASASMDPFALDREALLGAIQAVSGRDRTQVLRFRGSPQLADAGSPQRYSPPEHATPVLALTDLGIGWRAGRDVTDDWLELAGSLRRRNSRLVAAVPYPPGRWPAPLRREIAIVHWDRPTTVARVVQSMVRAERR